MSNNKQPEEVDEQMPERRHQVFSVSVQDVFRAIRGVMPLSTVVDLPADAHLVRAEYDIERDSFRMLVESEEFAPVPPEQRAPPYLGLWCYPPVKGLGSLSVKGSGTV